MKDLQARLYIGYAALLLLTLVVYANSLANPFHYDDIHSIVDNPHLRALVRVPSYFVDPSAFSGDPDIAMYRPMLLVTFALNHALGGYEVLGYHLLSIGLHMACVLFVGAIAKRLLGNAWAAFFAAGLFALHPIQTEPVNYISSRSEILAALFFLLGFWAYLLGGTRHWAWVGLAYAAGLLSKSIVVVLPAVLLAYEIIVRRRWPRDKQGLFALLFFVGGLYLLTVRSMLLRATITAPVRPYSEQFWTQIKAMVFYLQMLVWPANQSVDHQFILSDSLFDPIVAVASFFLLSLIWLGIHHRHPHAVPLFALAWFFIILAPSTLVPLNVLVNEHRLYLPGAAFAIAIAYAGHGLQQKIGGLWAGGLALLVLVTGAWATTERNEIWRDEYTLWGDAAAKAPLMARPFIYLGNAYARDGRVEEAVAAFEHVVRRDAKYAPAYAQLGKLYLLQGRDEHAAEILQRGFAVDGDNLELWVGLAEFHYGRQDWLRCRAAYQRAVELAPNDPGLRNNLGNSHQALGQAKQALVQHERALQLAPGNPETLLNLGNARLMLQDLQQAVDYYQQALSVRGDFAGAWFNLGYVYELLADQQRALNAYDRAGELDQGFAAQAAQRRQGLTGSR